MNGQISTTITITTTAAITDRESLDGGKTWKKGEDEEGARKWKTRREGRRKR